MAALYVDQHAVRGFAELPTSDADARYALAVTFATMLARELTNFDLKNKDSVGKEFTAWVFTRLIEKRAQLQPGLLESTAEYVKALLSDLIPSNLDSRPSQATVLLIQRLVRNLPRPLGERLARDSDFMARLGLKTIAVAEVGDLRFDKSVYISAITAAINGRQAVEAKLLNTDIPAQFEAATSATSTVRIHVPSTGESVVISDPIFGLLKDSTQDREMAASELGREFDLPPDEIRTIIAELASTEDNETRLRRAQELREGSIVMFYVNLEKKLSASSGISEADLVAPDAESILRHIRISSKDDGAASVSEPLARELIGNPSPIAASEVLNRLFRLPSGLPESVNLTLSKLSTTERDVLTRRLLKLPQTPLFRIHMASLFLRNFGDDPRYQKRAAVMVRRFIADSTALGAYLSFISWSLSRIVSGHNVADWADSTRLAAAWVHGDRIFGIVRQAHYDVAEVANVLARTPAHLQTMFAAVHPLSDDVANPNNLDPEILLLSGLSFACNGMTFPEPSLREQVATSLLRKKGEQVFPALGLIPPTTAASNVIGSIFGGDRIALLENWITPETYASIRERFEGAPAEQVIGALQDGDCDMWLWVSAVIGRFPLRAELIPSVEKAILACDFISRAKVDPQIACTTLLIASSVSRFLAPGPAIEHLENQIVGVARCLETQPRDPNLRRLAFVLLECVLHLVRRTADVSEGIANFCNIMAQLALIWGALGQEIRPFIQRLCDELPVERTTELWRLNCRLRTQK